MSILKKSLKKIINSCGFELIRKKTFDDNLLYNYDPFNGDKHQVNKVINLVKPFTLTTPNSILTLVNAVKYVVENKIPGSIVECGVGQGGSMMAVAKTLLDLNCTDRSLYLYDTFEGMTRPTKVDINWNNESAIEKFEKEKISHDSSIWRNTTLQEVKQAVYSVGYRREKIYFIKGKVEDTLPENAPESISILRLDTDWYESTRHELIHLYPHLSKGGIIILDDYDHWMGSKKATDEYFSKNKIPLLLNKIIRGGRIGVKI